MTDLGSSNLLQYLPAIYREEPFLGRFLLAFEKILFDGVQLKGGRLPAIEQTIAGIATYFDPLQAPKEFLPWLASWTAFSLRFDLDERQQRDFIANIIPLYRRRGTKRNLEELLRKFTPGLPKVAEALGAEFQIGVHSTIGADTSIGGGAAYFFSVTVSLPPAAPEVQQRQVARAIAIATALVELEKPAHTFFDLKVEFPSMQIGVHSQVGVDTLLGAG
jgi:phage tail-like protein